MQDTQNGSFPTQHDYTLGLGGVLYDNLNSTLYTPGVSQNVNGTDNFFHTDWLGSTRYLSDSTGNAFPSTLRYDAFGNRTDTSTPYDPTPFQFGADWGYQSLFASGPESGPGLQYVGQRYYDPAVGRFTSADPIGFAGGLNLFNYSDNDPPNEGDPSGLNPLLPVVAGGAHAVEAAGAVAAGEAAIAVGVAAHATGTFLRNAVVGFAQSAQDVANASVAIAQGLGFGPRPPLYLPGPGGTTGNLAPLLSLYAQTAITQVTAWTGQSSGAAFGTRVHTQFENLVKSLGNVMTGTSNLFTEVTYKGGRVFPRGTSGGVRLDVVVGPLSMPTAVYDLKTGAATLTPARIRQIRANLPPGYQNIPVVEIR